MNKQPLNEWKQRLERIARMKFTPDGKWPICFTSQTALKEVPFLLLYDPLKLRSKVESKFLRDESRRRDPSNDAQMASNHAKHEQRLLFVQW